MNVLFLTQRLPYAPNRGDRIRAYFLLREMSRFAKVSVFSLVHDDDEAAEGAKVPFAARVRTARVSRLSNAVRGAIRLPSSRPLTHSLLSGAHARDVLDEMVRTDPPDVVVAYCSGVARYALEPPLGGRPLVVDMVDVDSVKWAAIAGTSAPPLRWIYRREAVTLRRFEAALVRTARTTLVVNERERDALRQIEPAGRITVLPNGVDLDAFAPGDGPAEAPVVVFCGVMNYGPNVDGVRWFARDVWPSVRMSVPEARFLVVGADPVRAIEELARDASIEVLGRVPAVQPFLWRSAVSVAPLHLARGLQNKVLEALAAGLPAVVTPAVWEGLPPEVRPGCVAAADAPAFAAAVVERLRMSPALRRQLAGRADLARLGWQERFAPIEAILRAASARPDV